MIMISYDNFNENGNDYSNNQLSMMILMITINLIQHP